MEKQATNYLSSTKSTCSAIGRKLNQNIFVILSTFFFVLISSANVKSAEYRYLRLTALNGVNTTYNVYVAEIHWMVGSEIYPQTKATSASSNITATQGATTAWKAYDGLLGPGNLWNSQSMDYPYSITIDLGADNAIHPTGIQIATQWQGRAMSAFKCEGSNDNVTWTSLYSEEGLTQSSWQRDTFHTFEFPDTGDHGTPAQNLLSNGEFNNGSTGWSTIFQGAAADGGNFGVVTDANMSGSNAGKLSINNGGTANWNVELFSLFNLESGKTYEVTFKAKAAANRSALVLFQKGEGPYTHYWEQNVSLTTTTQDFGPYTWTADINDPATRLNFKVGGSNADIWIDAVVVKEVSTNLLSNGEFNNGSTGWSTIFQGAAADGGSFGIVTDANMSGSNAGKLSISNGGTANWNVELFSAFDLESGKTYEVTFKAKAAANRPALVLFQKGESPYTHYWEQNVNLTSTTQDFGPYTWTADVSDPATRLNFKVGGSNADIWIDAVVVKEVSSTGDTQAPLAPGSLATSNITENGLSLSWAASTDNVGVTSYEVFAGSVSKGTTSATSMNVTGLKCDTNYSITVKAKDAAGNVSAASAAKSVTTGACTVSNYPNENSMLGMNLAGPTAWSKEHIFTNLAHHSLDWMPLGSAPDFKVRIPRDELTTGKYLKAGQDGRLCVIWDLSTDFLNTGDFVFTYEGTANVSLSEHSTPGITVVSTTGKRIVINIPPLDRQVFLFFDIVNNSSSDQVRNIRFTEIARENSTDTFRPEFVNEYKVLKAYRFMDWMHTNNSTVSTWEEYKADNALLQTGGVSFNHMIALANQTNSDAWFCLPMLADDDFVRKAAIKIRDNLKPELRAYIELSNEVWNGQFLADNQAAAKAVEIGISLNNGKAHEDAAVYLGHRTAQIEQMFKEEFNKVSSKPALTTLIAWQAANPWAMENRIIPQYQKVRGGNAVPEALAIAPYFGGKLGSANTQSIVENWTVDMLFDQLNNNTYNDQVGDVTIEQSIGFMRNYKALIDEYNIPKLLAYEGGQHLVGTGSAYENVTMRNLFFAANRDRAMYDAYIKYFDAWKEIGGDLFATFSSTNSYGKSGSWGWKESPSQTRAQAPKYDAILTWNENNQRSSSTSSTMRLSNMEQDLSSEKNIIIYPNPVERGSITILFDRQSDNRLTIYNINGKVFLDETIDQGVKTIDLERYQSGMYFFKINGSTQQVIIR